MKALSLWQPHAQAVALGLKTFETRHWSSTYRGPLAIHAGKRAWIDEDDWHAEARRRLRRRMEERGCFGMAYGAVVCVVDLRDCVRIGRGEADASGLGAESARPVCRSKSPILL